MKFFLKKLISFSVVVIMICCILQAFVLFKINDGFKKKSKGILEQSENINAEVVLLGSSRCWMQLEPDFFEEAFGKKTANLGINGHGEISMAYIRLSDYLQRNIRPKFAILCFDPFTRPGDTLHNNNFIVKNAFAEYAFLPSGKDKAIVNYFGFTFFEKYMPLNTAFKYRLFNKAIVADGLNKQMKKGSDMYEEIWDTIARPVDRTGKYMPTAKKFDTNKISASLASLNLLCQRNNIRLLCLQLPVHESIYNPEVFALTSSVAKKNSIPFIDACDTSIMNNILFFYNFNHLNKAGIQRTNDFLRNSVDLNVFFKFIQ